MAGRGATWGNSQLLSEPDSQHHQQWFWLLFLFCFACLVNTGLFSFLMMERGAWIGKLCVAVRWGGSDVSAWGQESRRRECSTSSTQCLWFHGSVLHTSGIPARSCWLRGAAFVAAQHEQEGCLLVLLPCLSKEQDSSRGCELPAFPLQVGQQSCAITQAGGAVSFSSPCCSPWWALPSRSPFCWLRQSCFKPSPHCNPSSLLLPR